MRAAVNIIFVSASDLFAGARVPRRYAPAWFNCVFHEKLARQWPDKIDRTCFYGESGRSSQNLPNRLPDVAGSIPAPGVVNRRYADHQGLIGAGRRIPFFRWRLVCVPYGKIAEDFLCLLERAEQKKGLTP